MEQNYVTLTLYIARCVRPIATGGVASMYDKHGEPFVSKQLKGANLCLKCTKI